MTDWSVLNPDGSHADPIPGDPDEVDSLSKWFRQMSDDVNDSVGFIQHFDVTAAWRDQAAQRFGQGIDTLKKDLPKLRDSYGKAAWALSTYGGQLRASRRQAQQALSIALDAKANVDSAQKAKAVVTAAPSAGGPPPDTSSYDRQEQDGNDRLAQARTLLQQARDERDSAAAACRRMLQDAHNVGMHNRSWWDHVTGAVGNAFGDVGHFVDDHLEVIAKWSSNLSAWLGTAALILSFIPVVNVIAPGLETMSLALMVVSLAAKTALLAEGKEDWKSYCVDAGVTALAVVGFGASRMAEKAADVEKDVASEGVKSLAGEVAVRQARVDEAVAEGRSARSIGGSRSWLTRANNELDKGNQELEDATIRAYRGDDAVHFKWKNPVEWTKLKYGAPTEWSNLPTSVVLRRIALPANTVGHVFDTKELLTEPLPGHAGPLAAGAEGAHEGAAAHG